MELGCLPDLPKEGDSWPNIFFPMGRPKKTYLQHKEHSLEKLIVVLFRIKHLDRKKKSIIAGRVETVILIFWGTYPPGKSQQVKTSNLSQEFKNH